MKKGTVVRLAVVAGFGGFLLVSLVAGYEPGLMIGGNFLTFALMMVKLLPCAFVLVGLFEVWVRRETVEKHLGHGSGFKGFLWAILLAGTTVGGLYVGFPVAYALHRKGAKLSIIFTYIGAAGICRIPMTVFEASFMGVTFAAVRLLVSVPLVIVTSIFLGRWLTARGYAMKKGMDA